MNELDESLELRAAGPHAWAAHADPRREASTGMFGGWTAALLLKAVLADAGDQGSPVSLSVNFVSMLTPGSALRIATRPLGGGRALSTWQAEVAGVDAEGPAAVATVILARRRESRGFTDAQMPEAPPPDGLRVFHPPGHVRRAQRAAPGARLPAVRPSRQPLGVLGPRNLGPAARRDPARLPRRQLPAAGPGRAARSPGPIRR